VPPCDGYPLSAHQVTAFLQSNSSKFSRCVVATSVDKFVQLSSHSHGNLVVEHNYFQAIRSRWLTVLRLPDATLIEGSLQRAIRWNTNNQLEAACVGKPERLGWIPERGDPQMLLPAGRPRPPKHTSRAH